MSESGLGIYEPAVALLLQCNLIKLLPSDCVYKGSMTGGGGAAAMLLWKIYSTSYENVYYRRISFIRINGN